MIKDRSELPPIAREMSAPSYKGGGMIANAEAQSVFPELAIAPDRSGRVARSTSKEGRKMDMKMTELIVRMNKLGWKKAVVINLNEFPLTIDMGYCGRKTIRPKKQGEPLVKFVIENYVVSPREMPEGERIPEPTLPVEIAGEFTRNYKLSERSLEAPPEVGVGVFWYEYDARNPNDMPEDLLEMAQDLQFDWYRSLFEEAESLWSKNKNRREISDHMRTSARILKDAGAIQVTPEWVVSTGDQKAPPKMQTCPACATEAPAAAIFCLTCQTMFDPEKVREIRPDIYFAQRPAEARVVGAQGKPAPGLQTLNKAAMNVENNK